MRSSVSTKAIPLPDPLVLRDGILKTLDHMQGEDTVALDLSNRSDVTSFIIISSGGSTTKVGALAQEVRKTLKQMGAEVLNVAGTDKRDWVVIDANDCVVHLFRPPVRAFYNLEKLWAPVWNGEEALTAPSPFEVRSGPELLGGNS